MDKSLKSPKQLFEQKRKEPLEEFDRPKITENILKKILSPQTFFTTETEVLVDEQIDEIEIDDDSDIEYDIEEEPTLREVSETEQIFAEIFNLKNKISKIANTRNYDIQLESLTQQLVQLEKKIVQPKEFDPSDLYHNIALLKNKLEEVKSEIPAVPEPILYDEDLNQLKEMVESVRESIPIVPEIKDYDEQLNEILSVIEDVRNDIPTIPEFPEVKYYDDEISLIENRLVEIQNSIPEVKYYDIDVEEIREELKSIQNTISELPEVKYYDNELQELNDQLRETKNAIPVVPEVKYYDNDVKQLNDKIDLVKESIPTIPEIKYYDNDVNDLWEQVDSLNDLISKLPKVKYYDEEVEKISTDLKLLDEKVSQIEIPDQESYVKEVKDLHSSLEEKNRKLLEKINYLEEVFEKFNEQTILKEDLTEPPEVKNEDPLTPLDQNFVTLDQLQQHYKLFINRIQQQLATIGGGGETQLKYLDDVVGIATNPSAYNNKFLKYNHSIGKFEFASVGAGSQNLDDTLQLGNTSSLGMSVGVTTVTSLNIDTVAHFDTNTIAISSSSPTQIYSFSATDYRSARIQIQITQGSDYQTSDVLVIHNGTNANLVEYASISTNDYLGTFDAVIGSGNVSLQVLMASASSATIKVVSQVISL